DLRTTVRTLARSAGEGRERAHSALPLCLFARPPCPFASLRGRLCPGPPGRGGSDDELARERVLARMIRRPKLPRPQRFRPLDLHLVALDAYRVHRQR